jgi:hypothetical protein
MQALLDKQAALMANPANKTTGLFLYTPAARKKLDQIARDITHLLAEQRSAGGDPVRADGYSGRQTNRR